MNKKKAVSLLLAGMLTGMSMLSAMPAVSAESVGKLPVVVYTGDFESGVDGWTGRGDATVEVVDTKANSGTHSLFCTNRTEIWNGALLEHEEIKAGGTYKVSAYVFYANNDYWSQDFEVCLQYDQGESQSYPTIAKAPCYSGSWSKLSGEITIPTDAENICLYVQTAYTPSPGEKDLMDFYVDDVSCSEMPDLEIQQDIKSLKNCYSDYFKIGTAIMGSEVGIKPVSALIEKHFNSLTFGNELKPDFVLDKAATLAYAEETGDVTNPQINLAKASRMLQYAAANNIPVRGHTLVWHSQTPDWFFKENYSDSGAWVTPEVMDQRMENYIKNVMQTLAEDYPDVQFYAWDVVNEAMSEEGGPRAAGSNNVKSGESAWVSVYGDNSFVEKAFIYARKYAPKGCSLFYNDYNEYMSTKMDSIYALVKDLYDKGLCDGVGMQSHLDMDFPNAEFYENAVRKYMQIGCEIQVTELDITTWDFTEDGAKKQGVRYGEIFDVLKRAVDDGANITCVAIWGMIDPNSWRADRVPLIFDGEYQAKPAYYAIVEDMEEQEILPLLGDVNQDGKVQVADAVLLARYLVADKTLSATQGKNADLDKNGVLNGFDLTLLKQLLLAKNG